MLATLEEIRLHLERNVYYIAANGRNKRNLLGD